MPQNRPAGRSGEQLWGVSVPAHLLGPPVGRCCGMNAAPTASFRPRVGRNGCAMSAAARRAIIPCELFNLRVDLSERRNQLEELPELVREPKALLGNYKPGDAAWLARH